MPDSLPNDDLTGQSIGDFLVLRKIGQGGMGQVYLARQQSLKREVALKILKSELASNPTALPRFRAEAEAVARITHANIVQVYAIGEHAGIHFMALEYVEGRNLRDYLARKGPPDLPIALSIIRQVAAALQRANEVGLVHRDIKPENILVTRKAEVKVADFGLSRFFAGESAAVNLTQSGVTLGTPLYMSPEQIRGEPTDHRSDLYSLGVTSYHLLAGEPPFKGRTPFEVTIQHVQNEPPPLASFRPDLPADVCVLVHKLMAKKLTDRYQTARDVIRDLGKIREGLSLGSPANPSANPAMALSGVATSQPYTAFGTTLSLKPITGKWPWTLIAAYTLGALILGTAGYAIAATWNKTHPKMIVETELGLPTARPAERVISTRELDLRTKIENRSTTSDDCLNAAVQLGLLYIQERRWSDAEKLFKEMETDQMSRGPRPQELQFMMAGKLGRAITLSHQDRAADSTALFIEALSSSVRLRPSGDLPKGANARNLIAIKATQEFFLRHPDLSKAVAEAITRNAENGSKETKLEWLTKPGSLVSGPKG